MTKRRTLDREKVLATAEKLAYEQGLEALTMPNLAKALDIRSQSLYNYVANREEMVSLTGAQLMQQMYQQVVDGIIGLSGSKAYLKFADIVRDFLLAHASLSAILYHAQRFSTDSAMYQEIKRMIKLVDQVVDVDGNRLISSHVLIGAVLGYIFLETTPLYQAEDENVATVNYHQMLFRLIDPVEKA